MLNIPITHSPYDFVAQVNTVLPRTWRLVWTIGGTTPSFTITNVQVTYNL